MQYLNIEKYILRGGETKFTKNFQVTSLEAILEPINKGLKLDSLYFLSQLGNLFNIIKY